jgi:hypothetical protein
MPWVPCSRNWGLLGIFLVQDDEADSSEVIHHFIKAALPHLVPLLLEQLTKQVS